MLADSTDNKYSCIEEYLRSIEALSQGPRHFNESNLSQAECNSFVQEFRNNYYKDKAVNVLSSSQDEVDCIIDHFKKKRVADVIMEDLIYSSSEIISDELRKEKTDAILNAVQKQELTAAKFCQFKIHFLRNYFDLLYQRYRRNEPKASPEREYCWRKYIVENNYIDTSDYNVTLNPLDIDTSGIDCMKILESTNEKSEQTIVEIFENTNFLPKCLKKAFNDHKLYNIIARTCIYGEIGLSEEALNEERKKYMDEMNKFSDDLAKC